MAVLACPKTGFNSIRLVFLLEELNFGGTQRQTLELARRLDHERFHPEIWLLRSGDRLAPLARDWHIPLFRLSSLPWVGPLSLLNLWQQLKKEKIDLFLTLTAIPNIWGRLLGKLARLPCIIGNVRSNTADRQHEGSLWPLANHLICNNHCLEKLLINSYRIPPGRLTMIPNGVDTDFFQPAPATSPDSLKVVSIGRLTPDKDQETLIHAFKLVLQDHPDAELWLVGDGPCRQKLSDLMQQNLPARQTFLLPGQVDIRPFLQQSCLFVLSSVTEALPNVVLEAMATGLPVVATSVGGLPEAVISGETGLLVPSRDPVALAEAMGQLLADESLRRRFGRAGRNRVEEKFSFNRMVSRYEALFDDLLCPQRTS